MINKSKLGIWMDHANAHLIEFPTDDHEESLISSKFTHEIKSTAFDKSENLMHNKERHEQLAFYKKLGIAIRNYESVILFGPTNAKVELYNFLRADHNFANIKIETKHADKMTDRQQYAFVKHYFDSQPRLATRLTS